MNNLSLIHEITFLIYVIIGWILIAFSIVIIKQVRVNLRRRSSTAGFHFVLGMAFCFAAARIATGGAILYMYLVLIACLFIVYFAFKQMMNIYRQNKYLKEKDKFEKTGH